MFIDRSARYLLGLEEKCYDLVGAKEKSFIYSVLLAFVIVLVCCILAMFVIGLFVSGNTVIAIGISILGTFVFISIFRFSLTLIKPDITLLKNIKDVNTILFKSTWKEKWQKTVEQFKKISKFNFKSDWSIPGFTSVFRLLYMGLLAFVLIFPLTTLTHWSETMEYNVELRNKALLNYNKTIKNTKTIYSFNDEIAFSEKMSWYEEKVSNEYYTMQLFKRSINYPLFSFICIFICFALFFPHFLLFKLMRNESFIYVSSLKDYFKSMIERDFQELNKEAKNYLNRYSASANKIDLSYLNKDNPYIEKLERKEREKITWDQYEVISQSSEIIK